MEKNQFSFLNNEFEVGLVMQILHKYFAWLIVLPIVGASLAFLVVRYSLPVYESTAVVKIEDKNEMGGLVAYEDIYASNINGEVTLLRSKKLFEKATENLPLNVSYYTKGRFMDTENYRISDFRIKHQIKESWVYQTPVHIDFLNNNTAVIAYEREGGLQEHLVPLNQWVSVNGMELSVTVSPSNIDKLVESEQGYYFVVNSESEANEQNHQLLNVQVVDGEAKTLSISFTGNSAQKVTDLANALSTRFLVYNVEKKKKGANQKIEFTNERLDKVNNRIAYYERQLQPYRKFENENGGFTNVQFTAELMQKIETEAKNLLKTIDGLSNYLATLQNESDHDQLYATIISSVDNRYIQGTSVALKGMLQQRRDQIFKLKENSFEFKELDYKISLEIRDLIEVINALIEEQKKDLEELESRKEKYESMTGLTGESAFDKDYLHLKRMYKINKELYTALLSKKAEYEMVRAGYVSDNEIIEPASVPNKPISPNIQLVYLSFSGGGLAIALLILTVIYLFHNTISGPQDIQSHKDLVLLGMVPSYNGDMPVSQLLVSKNPKSLMSEAFRSIRSNLQFLGEGVDSKVLSITSTVSGEGKTFVAINLSGVIAFSEKKVVILDLDMRKPKIHLGFGVQNTLGMSSLLSGKTDIDAVLQKSSMPNLDFITAGAIPPNPSELIMGSRMNEIIAELKRRYDVVVIDNPPVGIVTDAIPLLQIADYPVYVLRAGVSKKFFLNNIAGLKAHGTLKNLSVILNGVERRARYGAYGSYGYGYVYSSGYGYGYGGGYGYTSDDNIKKRRGLARLLRRKKKS